MFAIHLKVVRYFLMLMFFGFWLSGCATQIRPVIPPNSGDITIKAKFFDLGLNRPFGSYDIEGSSFIVGKATKVKMGEAAFGALGALAAHSRGKTAFTAKTLKLFNHLLLPKRLRRAGEHG